MNNGISHFLALAWRTLWRDVRAGELRLLLAAVVLAVGALTAVGFFADRLQAGLARNAGALLGGDAVLVSDHPPGTAWTRQADAPSLAHALTLTLATMARASASASLAPGPGDGAAPTRLVILKAVSAGYPLRGSLRTAVRADDLAGQVTREIPAPGAVWVDASLLTALNLHLGDALLLGDARFRIDRVIVLEPDRGGGFVMFGPRAMINSADLPATHLVQPASRVTYRLAVAGTSDAVRRFADQAKRQLEQPGVRGMRLETLETGRPEIQETLDRAGKFLNLVALLAALLAAVAVALAARSFAARHLDDCALLRVLGLSQRGIALAYAAEFLLAGLAASLAGVLLGYAVHYGFVWLLSGLIKAVLPAPTLRPAALGLGVGLTLLAAFGLPPVLRLSRVPALRVLRRDLGMPGAAPLVVLAAGMAGFAALLLAASRDWTLGGIAVGGFAGAVLVFAGLAWAAVWALRRVVKESTAPRWLLLTTRQVAARPIYAVVQVCGLAVGLTALALLALLRTDLIASWRQATPANAPNRFVINIMPDQAPAFRAALARAGVTGYDWYPMFRGRLVAINGRTVSPADYPQDRARRLVDREFNLSYAAQSPPHNPIVAGRWQSGQLDAGSVEEGLAQTLGLKMGDLLSFDVGGMPVQGHITSLRKVQWASMRANFFVMFPLAAMPDMPVTYLTAYRAPAGDPGLDNALVRDFPNITSVDMGATLAQIQAVLDQVTRAVQWLFGFTLAAGLVVLLAAVGSTREARAREYAILRALGASGRLLGVVQRAELAGVGLLAGLLAGLVAMLVAWLLARYAFDFDWHPRAWAPLASALAGAALALAAGWWSLRGILTRPVAQTLRQAVLE
jgi:putative ABC transport system permease protein